MAAHHGLKSSTGVQYAITRSSKADAAVCTIELLDASAGAVFLTTRASSAASSSSLNTGTYLVVISIADSCSLPLAAAVSGSRMSRKTRSACRKNLAGSDSAASSWPSAMSREPQSVLRSSCDLIRISAVHSRPAACGDTSPFFDPRATDDATLPGVPGTPLRGGCSAGMRDFPRPARFREAALMPAMHLRTTSSESPRR
mmetsp:Transcript_29206/g.87580  ORF Transcript_29206/g.87580 Transcript_29206/m.87580 type:complete len:200 (+) Transcript_29206:247-846(+)